MGSTKIIPTLKQANKNKQIENTKVKIDKYGQIKGQLKIQKC